MFDSVLVANRGEIAVRIFRTLRRLGVRSIAVYSDADRQARHVREADVALRIGPPPAIESYLDIAAVLAAAGRSQADAVHPGYGFLAENAAFARACEQAGVSFIGPPAAAIEAMGDKIRARRIALEARVEVVPGRSDPGMSDADLLAAARQAGFPLLVKPSAGGGGKGMRLVQDERQLSDALPGARREAMAAFGDDTLFVERYVAEPRHIEIQVFFDAHGNAVQLGERECSIQRRHQKIIEETPSPLLDEAHRRSMGKDALRVAAACGYVGAGTVEFIVSGKDPDRHYFLEMNTRLQVEHPVTELVTGIDLVEWQLVVASGGRLPALTPPPRNGHAIEARLYAEDPGRGFLPTGGHVVSYEEPTGEGIRVDSGIESGAIVSSLYDPMLAKVVAWGNDREEAIDRLRGALGRTVVAGVRTNLAFLSHLLGDRRVVAGALDTGLAERSLESFAGDALDEEVLVAAVLGLSCELGGGESGRGPWAAGDGWRLTGRAWTVRTLEFEHDVRHSVAWRNLPDGTQVRIGDDAPVTGRAVLRGDRLAVSTASEEDEWRYLSDGAERVIAGGGSTFRFRVVSDYETGTVRAGAHLDATVRSPMPGSVVAVRVSAGDVVEQGDVLVVVEAMKMEHSVVAPIGGEVVRVLVSPGDRVAMDEELAVVVASAGEPSATGEGVGRTREDR